MLRQTGCENRLGRRWISRQVAGRHNFLCLQIKGGDLP